MTPASQTPVSDDSTASVTRLSPTFSLTETQKHLVDDIIAFCQKHIHDRQAVLILEG